MDKKIVVIGILSMFLLLNLNSISSEFKIVKGEMEDFENALPVMRADNQFLEVYEQHYNNEEEAFIDSTLAYEIQSNQDFSILDLLSYIPAERTQGGCGNCWAWPSTSVLAIALRVQENVIENRLSVQYINTCGELYPSFPRIGCCEGGTIGMLAAFYRSTGIAIPWSNDNAHWQDYVIAGQCEQVECHEIAKNPNYPISSIRSKRITTRNVPEETAINNIKNILHQNRGVYFSVFYADRSDLNNFRSFWRNENEEAIYDLDHYAGNSWDPDEAVGHAMLIVGYHDDENSDDGDYWIFLNSWGTNSGRPNGLLRVGMHMNYSLKFEGSRQFAFGAETLNVTFGSEAPTAIITGPTSGRIHKLYTFDVSAVDPQGDDVYLFVNWGDGTDTGWRGPYESSEVIQVRHIFSEQTNYTIKAKAKDIYDNEGKEQPLRISFSRSKILSMERGPLLNLLFRIYSLFTRGTVLFDIDINGSIENCYPCNQS